MPDSVSSTVGLCRSRILGSPQLRFIGSSVSPRATRTSSTGRPHAALRFLLGAAGDDLKSYFFKRPLSRMVTLRQLRYLEALAETLHFGQAAEACAVTQPALGMQINELEEELQVSLIERRKSGIELTEQGEEIVRRGRTTLPQCAMCSSIASVCCRERSSSGPFCQSRPISCRWHCPSCNGAPRSSLCTSARRSLRRLFGSWSAAIST